MKRIITLLAVAGMVFALAPAAPAAIITGVTATARSEFESGFPWGRPAANAVNGVGMSGEGATGLHQNSGYETGWSVGQAGNIAHWFKVDLGDSYDVGNMYVWNGAPPNPGWGALTVDIYYSNADSGNNSHLDLTDFDTSGWTFWGTAAGLAQHANTGSYLPTDTIALDVNARYIVLNVTVAHGGINNTSISELQFDGVRAGIEKSVSETAVNLDLGLTNLTYTIDILNTYTTALSGVVVTDALPAEVSFVSSIPPASMTNNNDYIFDIGNLEPGSNAVITMLVTVTSTVPGVITNVAMLSATNTNVIVTAQATAETLLYYPADLDVTKTAFVNGTNVDYTITIVNLGSGDATDVTVVDTLPAELNYQSASPPPGPPVGNPYTFNLGTVPAGSNATIMISATYTSTASIFVTNSASADTSWFEDNMANNTGTVITPVGGGLVLLKSVSDPLVNLDLGPTNLIYTLDILNTHTVSLSGIVVTDALPVGVSFVTSSLAATETNGNAYTFDVGTLEAGSNAIITLEVAVTTTVSGVLTNFAMTSATNTNVAAVGSMDTAETLLYYPADLEVHKTASLMGTNLTYTLAITNLGAGAAANLVVTDSFPAAVTFLSAVPNFSSTNGNDYIFNLGTLVAGGSTTITINAEYTSTVPIIVTNSAGAGTSWFEDNRSNNTDTAISALGAVFDLSLIKTVNPTNLSAGASNLVYTIAVDNLSTQFVCNVVVTDTLPAGVVFQFATPPAVQTNGDSYVFALGCLAPSGSTSVVINASYTSSVSGITLTNWATVTGTNAETFLMNNSDFALATVAPGCSTNDTDGDGMNDCEEECAGTDPMDPNSFLWIQIARTGTQTVRQLTFPTTTGRTYRVDLNTNLYSNVWTTVISNLPGLGTDRNVMHTSSAERVYYRVGAESP